MKFTSKEKIAIDCILSMLMRADGRTVLSEAATLFFINKTIGISINEAEDSSRMSFDDAKAVLSVMDNEKKDVVKKMFDEMAFSDGIIDEKEKEILETLF